MCNQNHLILHLNIFSESRQKTEDSASGGGKSGEKSSLLLLWRQHPTFLQHYKFDDFVGNSLYKINDFVV